MRMDLITYKVVFHNSRTVVDTVADITFIFSTRLSWDTVPNGLLSTKSHTCSSRAFFLSLSLSLSLSLTLSS
jgi:hypothetical protein